MSKQLIKLDKECLRSWAIVALFAMIRSARAAISGGLGVALKRLFNPL